MTNNIRPEEQMVTPLTMKRNIYETLVFFALGWGSLQQ